MFLFCLCELITAQILGRSIDGPPAELTVDNGTPHTLAFAESLRDLDAEIGLSLVGSSQLVEGCARQPATGERSDFWR